MKKLKTFAFYGILILFTIISAIRPVHAEIRMPQIFSDNMVLQRDTEVTIWGWADPGERVRVRIDGQQKTTRADRQGNWRVALEPVKAGGPHTLSIEGNNTIVYSNILFGEVWLCSGQSNMQWTVAQSANPEEEILNANYPEIRLFSVPRRLLPEPANDLDDGEWLVCSPETVASFSAVGYYFGRHLHQELDVPIGLVNSSWGGTNVETWTSLEMMQAHPDFAERMKEPAAAALARLENAPRPNDFPTLLFNGMIYPIVNYTIKGTIWYQGESNSARAYQYRTLFPNLIQDWRNQWSMPEMPFLFVQLANFRAPDEQPVDNAWAELREAQTMTLTVPYTGMAVAIDIGEAGDIHPKNKQDVGLRLALNALKISYGKDIVYSGPMYKSMQSEGNRIRVRFDSVGSGLKVNDKYGYLKAFAVAGNDRVFHWAQAYLDGNDVVVYSDQVASPVAVRYAWGTNPDDANLYNVEGLPASPFRTDTWPGITE